MESDRKFDVRFWTGRSWVIAARSVTSDDAARWAAWLREERRAGRKHLGHFVNEVQTKQVTVRA